MVERRLAAVLAAAVLLPAGYDRPGAAETPQPTASACRAERAPGAAQQASWCAAGSRTHGSVRH